MANQFQKYASHLANSSVPVLGMLAWYSVPESIEIRQPDFTALIKQFKAPIKEIAPPKAHDVFRRACNESKRTKVPAPKTGTFYNYTMRDAGQDNHSIYRNLVEEVVDSKNHSLGYREIGQAVFNRATGKVEFSTEGVVQPDDVAYAHYLSIMEFIKDFMDNRGLFITPISLREACRKTLEGPLLGTRARPGGGIYFVANEKYDALEAVNSVINAVPAASFHILPLVDDKRQREMLKEAFEDESIEDTYKLISEITEMLGSDEAISAKKFLAIQQRHNDLQAKMGQYSKILDDALVKSSTALDLCNQQLVELLDMTE